MKNTHNFLELKVETCYHTAYVKNRAYKINIYGIHFLIAMFVILLQFGNILYLITVR